MRKNHKLKLVILITMLVTLLTIALGIVADAQSQTKIARYHTHKKKAVITAYCLRGRTATGTRTRKGICAVNTQFIPLHSTIIVPGYGRFTAEDKLPRNSRAHVDLWMPSRGECRRFGRRTMVVKVIHKH
jgi:3D (Asp-Asp-Asp) domain-containing protein